MSIKTYSELIILPTFRERYRYLRLGGIVGEDTFGFDRYLNQELYTSAEWRRTRDRIIVRDFGGDLAMEGRDISGPIIVHHMNPITLEDIINKSDDIFNPEYLICTTPETHRAIHYGDEQLLYLDPVVRMPGDTCPWR